MPLPRSTPPQIRDRMATEMETVISGSDPRSTRSVEGALIRAVALVSHELQGRIEYVFRQRFPDTAEDEYLERHGALCRPIVTRGAAIAASGSATLTGEPATTVPAWTELRRSDDERYATLDDATMDGAGAATVEITALVAGAAGNTAAGTKLTFISPVAGVQSQATVAAPGIGGGADIERDESLRARIIERLQEEADGGNNADWRGWVQEVVGATRVWPYPLHMGPGTVGVTFIMPDGSMPDAPTLEAVAANLHVKRPVTATLHLFAPAVTAIDLTIEISPDTAAVRAAVEAEAADFFIREAEPGGTLPRSRLSDAISSATGQYSHKFVGVPEEITTAAGHIARLGAITWAAP
ncbi:baseplate J/gp47 family protein [Parvibaculum sp.]|uniref:baseplate J/gp47 family protein n=1 Tax=Parvibaculum sp. TaxID=2024848 RepID=UPI0027361183|nr:baseplate J/gp47 family protein [Parvibaculum sp.]MDP3329427.1 baseplate J/gp47 family protein [Parvibaculum sp.]